MFAIERTQKDGFDTIVLIDESMKSSVEIVPDCGAMLRAFTVENAGEVVNVIDSYSSKNEFDSQAESKGFKGLKLSPFPCRIQHAAYRFENKDYHFRTSSPNGSALHGLLYKAAFFIVEQKANEQETFVRLLHSYKATDAGYPFEYDCVVTYTLQKNNTLGITTCITNTGEVNMPIADGWHPYFSFKKSIDELELQFASEQMVEFVNLIPSGKTVADKRFTKGSLIGSTELDNSFVLDFSKPQPLCVLRDPVSQWQLELYPEESYPYLQIYIPPHRKSIAIENLSAPPDSFNNGMGLVSLGSGEQTVFSVKYALSKKT